MIITPEICESLNITFPLYTIDWVSFGVDEPTLKHRACVYGTMALIPNEHLAIAFYDTVEEATIVAITLRLLT